MKNSKLLLLGAMLVSALGVVGCGQVEQPTTSAVEDAATYVFQLYRSPEAQAGQYEVPNTLNMEIGQFTIEWSISLSEEVSTELATLEKELVTLTATETTTKVTPDIVVATSLSVDANYSLVAKVMDAEGNSHSRAIRKSVPKAPSKTVAEFHNLAKGEYAKLEGVVTAVNKVGKAGAFILTDDTGSTFSYSGADVVVGKKYSMVGMRDDYSGFAQLANVSIIETLGENQLGSVLTDKVTTITIDDVKTICSGYASEATKTATIKEYSPKFYKITGGYLVKNGSGYLGLLGEKPATETTENKNVNVYFNNNDSLKDLVNTQVDMYCAIRGFGASYITVQVLYCVAAGTAVTF